MTDPEPQPLSDARVAELRRWIRHSPMSPVLKREELEALLAAREQLVQAERDRRTVEEQFDAVLADYHEATNRAEEAEVSCAALREWIGEGREQLCNICDDGSIEPRRTCCYTAVNAQHTQQCILAQPSPGAALLAELKRLRAGVCARCSE